MFDLETRPKTSARRERLTGMLRGQKGLADLGMKPVASRRSQVAQLVPGQRQRQQEPTTRAPRQLRPLNQEEQEYYTEDDQELQPGLRRRAEIDSRPEARPARRGGNGGGGRGQRPASVVTQPRSSSRFRLHPAFFWLGLVLLLFLGLWQLTTSGAAWVNSHITDPGTYGQTGGTTITAVLGGGDSTTTPTKIIALNNNGQVQLIIITANNPAKTHIITGPDLVSLGFPDPAKAVIAIQAGDFNGDGKEDLKITVWSYTYTMPFQRYGINFLLTGDGKGSFAQVTQTQK